MDLTDALAASADSLMALDGVVGVGETEQGGRPAILVMAARLTDELRAAVPRQIEGFPVVIEETGEISAFEG